MSLNYKNRGTGGLLTPLMENINTTSAEIVTEVTEVVSQPTKVEKKSFSVLELTVAAQAFAKKFELALQSKKAEANFHKGSWKLAEGEITIKLEGVTFHARPVYVTEAFRMNTRKNGVILFNRHSLYVEVWATQGNVKGQVAITEPYKANDHRGEIDVTQDCEKRVKQELDSLGVRFLNNTGIGLEFCKNPHKRPDVPGYAKLA